MATILDFRPATYERSRETAAQAGGTTSQSASAELIFFPGVRYERAEPQSAPRKRKARGRAHDQIDLPD